MPNTQSAKKALRQSERRRVRTISTKRGFKKAVKQLGQLVDTKNLERAGGKLP